VLGARISPADPADRHRRGQVAIEEDHQLAKQAAGLDSGQVIRWRSWHRWSTLCLLACIYLAVAAALDRDAHAGREIGLIPVTIPEMLRMLRGTVIPWPAGTTPTASTGRNGDAATSTGPAKPTGAGMPAQMSCPGERLPRELLLSFRLQFRRSPGRPAARRVRQ
jgi:hypothetical protein